MWAHIAETASDRVRGRALGLGMALFSCGQVVGVPLGGLPAHQQLPDHEHQCDGADGRQCFADRGLAQRSTGRLCRLQRVEPGLEPRQILRVLRVLGLPGCR
ncbi:hypothetical protein ACF09Y_05670 [Streptomyces massasporeus]|uniref:hypothetical protein n=1 Tax=Streptomyces massasporeus TaxID=67324 RepID=UPI0036FFE57E